MAAVSGKRGFLTELSLRQIHRLAAAVVQIGFIVFEHALAEIQNSIGGDLFQQNGGIVPPEDVSGIMGIDCGYIGGISVKADSIVLKGTVGGVDPHVSKA